MISIKYLSAFALVKSVGCPRIENLVLFSADTPGALATLSMRSLDINIKDFAIIGKGHVQQKYD